MRQTIEENIMSRVYIAGKWDDRDQVITLMSWLNKMSVVVSHDWTAQEHKEETMPEWLRTATMDVAGIRQADFLVAIMDREYVFRGTWVEIGYALALGKTAMLVGAEARKTNFCALPNVRLFKDIYDLKDWWLNGG